MSTITNLSILASAGTGKTFRLSDRIIQLLAQNGVKHENIAALTFTRAAAAEFIVKLVQKLEEAATDEKKRLELCERIGVAPDVHDRAWFLNTLRSTLLESNRMTMGTLDSFFAKLVRSFPLEVGIQTGVATTVSDHEADDLRMAALQQTLNNMDPEHTAQLLSNLRNFNDGEEVANPMENLAEMAKAHHELLVIAPEPDKWGNANKIWDGCPPIWSGYAKRDLSADWDTLQEALSKNHGDAGPEGWPADLQALPAIVSDRNPRLGELNKVLDFLEGTMRSPMGTASKYFHRKDIELNAAASDAARRLMYQAIDKAVNSKLKQTLALFQCLKLYEDSYDTINRKQGRLGFSDYVTLLTRAPDFKREEIAFRLDGKINHWLLDEFQDTSTLQFKVLEKNLHDILSTKDEARSVFVVGDLKQSLYEWRSGNRKLLERLNQRIDRNGKSIPLDATRRCAQPVLDMVNLVLTYTPKENGLFPNYFGQLAAKDWAGNFRPQQSFTDPNASPKKGESFWYRVSKTKTQYANPTQETKDQAIWIAKHLKETPDLLDKQGRLQHGITCAILVSKNKQAATIAEELRKLGIEASEEAKTAVIEDNPVTAGLAGIIRAIVHPDNGLQRNLAEISPAANATLTKLGGWSGAAKALTRTFHQEGAEAMVDLLVNNTHPAALSDAFIKKRLSQFRTIAVRYDGSGRRDLVEFADYIGKNELRDSADERTIQILTIHRSKGLEYDIVYLPCLNDSHRTIAHLRRGDLLSMPTNEAALDFSPAWLLGNVGEKIAALDPVLEVAIAKAKAEAAYGALCKLYVGMTRARHRLVMLTMPLSEKRAGLIGTPEGTHDFAALLESTLKACKTKAKTSEDTKKTETDTIQANPCELMWSCPTSDASWLDDRIKKRADVPLPFPGFRPARQYEPVVLMHQERPSKTDTQPAAHQRKQRGNKKRASKLDPRELGNAVHALLEHLDHDIDGFITDAPKLTIPSELRHAHEEALAIALDCAQSADFRELIGSLSPAGELWKEREMTVSTEPGKVIVGKSDRIHVEPGKSATIIDYKTVEEDMTAEDLRVKYAGQMRLYRQAVAKLCGLPPEKVRCVLVHVRLGELVEC